MHPLDPWRAAKRLKAHRGLERAMAHAAQRIFELSAASDHEGARAWTAIMGALAEMREAELRELGERV